MTIIRHMTLDKAIDDIVDLLRTITVENPNGQADNTRVRDAIYHITSFVTGLDPYLDYPMDDLMDLIATHRADVIDALKERGLSFHLSALNNGMVMAEVLHRESGRTIHSSITSSYSPDLLAKRFYASGSSTVGTIH